MRPPACRLEISGTVPQGAGLSSSAALCVALCLALLAAAGEDEPDRTELARLCSRIENDWVGARTGLLDQLASLNGREGHALRIDMARARPSARSRSSWAATASPCSPRGPRASTPVPATTSAAPNALARAS